MKKLIYLLILLPSIVYSEAKNEASIGYFHEDVCWTTNKDGCQVEGLRISVVVPVKNFYLKPQVWYQQSIQEKVEGGNPAIQSLGGGLGVGYKVDLEEYLGTPLKAAIEASYLEQSDKENLGGNANYNNGHEIRAILEHGLDERIRMGLEAAYQDYPKDFDLHIVNEVENGHLAGCFRLQFDHSHWWLRLASWLTQFHWRACRGGDQSQFITKALFDDIGGFDESYTIYEDNILINELYKRKQFKVINKKLRTSARRYEKHGIWKLQYHFWAIYVKKWLGASAEDLYNYYKKYIA